MTKIRILVAEDNLEHQGLLLAALSTGRPQVDVTLVNSGAEFLDAIQGGRFDCAVMDYNLNDYVAPELIAVARGEKGEQCPMLIISSSEEQHVVIESIRSGGVDFVPKLEAVRGDILWQRVKTSILRSRTHQRNRRKEERRKRYLTAMSETDELTGLANRRHLQRCLSERRWENDRRLLACVMLDIDHFKRVNDTLGHAAGDKAIQAVSRVLRQMLGHEDTAIRYGGEELLIVRPTSSLADVWIWAEQVRRRVEETVIDHDSVSFSVTISIGVSLLKSPESPADAIEQADRGLYLAKHMGRNRVCTWDMAQIAGQLEKAASNQDKSLEQRRLDFLMMCSRHLGPTQWEHLTSHTDQVGEVSSQIARIMCLKPDAARQVQAAAMLHDIGKCCIPEEMLAKPSSLAVEEWRLIAQHSEHGAWIAQNLGADDAVVEMVRHHHMRYDNLLANTGRRTTLSLGARIVCVADAIVTMMTDRVYRRGRSASEAMRELQCESGRQFDPEVVQAAYFIQPVRMVEAA